MTYVTDFPASGSNGFQRIVDAFLSQPGLPLASVLSADRIKRVFERHRNLFGGSIYTTAVMVWSFLGQVLRDGKEASCQSAVARVVTYYLTAGSRHSDRRHWRLLPGASQVVRRRLA